MAQRTTRSIAPARPTSTTGRAFAASILQADTLSRRPSAPGKKVASVEWVGSRNLAHPRQGPVIDFRNFFSTRGVLVPRSRGRAGRRGAFGVSYQVASFDAGQRLVEYAGRRRRVSPPQQAVLTVATTFAAQNPTRTYDVYLYDSVVDGTSAYDRVLLARPGSRRTPAQAAADLGVGDWVDVRLTGADGLIGARAGQTAGFYVKLIDLAGGRPVVVQALLHLGRARSPPALVRPELREHARRPVPDQHRGRLRAARGGDHRRGHLRRAGSQVGGLPLGGPRVHPRPRSSRTPICCSSGTPSPTSSRTSSWGSSRRPTWTATRTRTSTTSRTTTSRTAAWRSARATSARRTTRRTRRSPSAGRSWAANRRLRLVRSRLRAAVVRGQRRQVCSTPTPAAGAEQISRAARRQPSTGEGCWAGGTAQIYINPARPAGPTSADRCGRDGQIVNAFQNLTDPANPGKQVVLKIMLKEELRERRRYRLAPSQPQRRRRRRAPAALPVRCGDAGPADRVLAVLRPARVSAGPRRPRAQREHARDVRRGGPGHPEAGPGRGRPRDRPRADDRVPAEHPRAAERQRARSFTS